MYETLKKHGLNLPTLIADAALESNEVAKRIRNPREETRNLSTGKINNIGEPQNSFLVGNIEKQKRFLDEEFNSRPELEEIETDAGKGDGEDEKETNDIQQSMDLQDVTMKELIVMKEMTDEIYGPGIFYQAVGEDFSRLINKVRMELNQKKLAA